MSLDAAAASQLFRSEPDRYLDVGDAQVAYRSIGQGPHVLFIHGWPVSSATFRTLLPWLVEHVTCHLVDLPGAGASRFTSTSTITMEGHIDCVRRIIDQLGFDSVAVVGHDSGGLIARHAIAGDQRLRALALMDTEPSKGVSWKFRTLLAGRHIPGYGRTLGWLAGKPRLRRTRAVFGDVFVESSHLDGEFDEFFLRPLHSSHHHRAAATRLLKSFDYRFIRDLGPLHSQIDVPVVLVWGANDRYFPVKRAREMVNEFPSAHLEVIPGAGLFAHEERPGDVAQALLPTLLSAQHRPYGE